MGSRRSLLALSLVAAVLAVLAVVDGPRGPAVLDTRVLPELQNGEVVALRWSGDTSGFALRRFDSGWRVAGGNAGPGSSEWVPANRAAVDRVLGALEFLRYERRSPAPSDSPAGDRSRLAIALADGRELELGLPPAPGARAGAGPSAPLPWIQRGPERFLIRAATARLLRPSLRELWGDAVFDFDVDGVGGLDIGRPHELIAVSGPPWQVHAAAVAGPLRADERAVTGLLDLLGQLRATRRVDDVPPTEGAIALRVRVRSAAGDQVLEVLETCPGYPGERLARTRLGAVCVSADAVEAVSKAAPHAHGLVNRRATSFEPDRVTSVEVERAEKRCRVDRRGATWTLACAAGEGELEAEVAEPGAVLEALAVLGRSLGDFVALTGRSTETLATLRLARGSDREVVRLLDDAGRRYVRRGDETVAFALSGDGWAAWLEPAQLRSRQVVDVEPTRIRALEWRRAGRSLARLERGRLVSEWSAVGSSTRPGVPAARDAVARLRALSVRGSGAAPRNAVELLVELEPAPGRADADAVRLWLWRAGGACLAQRSERRAAPIFEVADDACRALGPPTR